MKFNSNTDNGVVNFYIAFIVFVACLKSNGYILLTRPVLCINIRFSVLFDATVYAFTLLVWFCWSSSLDFFLTPVSFEIAECVKSTSKR